MNLLGTLALRRIVPPGVVLGVWLLCFALAPLAALEAQQPVMGGGTPLSDAALAPHVPGEVLVTLAEGMETARARILLEGMGLQLREQLNAAPAYRAAIVDGSSIGAMLSRLKSHPQVRAASPNFLHPRPGEGSRRGAAPL